MSIQGVVFVNPTIVDKIYNVHRLMLVWDYAPEESAVAAVTDILHAAQWDSHLNLNNTHRFRVLRDQRFVLGNVIDHTSSVEVTMPLITLTFPSTTSVGEVSGLPAEWETVPDGTGSLSFASAITIPVKERVATGELAKEVRIFTRFEGETVYKGSGSGLFDTGELLMLLIADDAVEDEVDNIGTWKLSIRSRFYD